MSTIPNLGTNGFIQPISLRTPLPATDDSGFIRFLMVLLLVAVGGLLLFLLSKAGINWYARKQWEQMEEDRKRGSTNT